METKIENTDESKEDHPGHNILVGVPVFGGLLQYKCANALLQLDRLFREQKIVSQIRFIANDALISRVRNQFANAALSDNSAAGGKFTHLLFIDSDIAFDPLDILVMLNADKPICALPYAVKSIRWKNIVAAVKSGVPAEHLAHFVGGPVMKPINGFDGPLPVMEVTPICRAGTGLLLIKTEVFRALAEAHPEWKYKMTSIEIADRRTKETEAFDFFRVGVHPKTREYLSEDYFFCEEARALGHETYLVPWAQTIHTGSFEYRMNLPALASLGVPIQSLYA